MMISSAQLLRFAKTSDASAFSLSTTLNKSMPADTCEVPADQLCSKQASFSGPTTYRHDPYAFNALKDEYVDLGKRSCESIYGMSFQEFRTDADSVPMEAVACEKSAADSQTYEAKQEQLDLSGSVNGEDGVSEIGSEQDCAVEKQNSVIKSCLEFENQQSAMPSEPRSVVLESMDGFVFKFPRPSVFRYASVNFRFGSAWFIAPFRIQPGDMVVAEYPLNKNMHMGIVSAITTVKPATFYTDGNTDTNYLTDEEMETLPRLIRHARDHDKDTKLEMRRYDLRSLENACKLAEELQAPVTFLDAEWLMGLNVITFLVHVYGDITKVDQVADALAKQEVAEVVFTYPAVNSTSS